MAGGNLGHGVQAKLRGNILRFPVKIATAIYRGTQVAIDAAGYLIQAGDGAAMKFVGIAEEGCTAAEAVADGTMNLKVRRHGIFRMTKNTTSAVTDLGLIAYMHTTHSSSVDGLVGLAGTTYNNAVGLIVRREPDTPGGTAFTNNWLMVDITPSPWSVLSLTTHAGLADQTAHTQDAIAPVLSTDATNTVTVSSAEFISRLMTLSVADAVAITLPATGPNAGTTCRFVKTGTEGLLTIGATTLVGLQTTGNFFIGCGNPGDSVDIQCVGADSYIVVAVHQGRVLKTIVTDTTMTAVEFMSGAVDCTKATAQAVSLPASGVVIGAICVCRRLVNASAVTISATALDGGASSANAHAACDAIGDSIMVMCNGDDDYTVIAESVA